MRLKPTLKKTVISLITGLVLAFTLFLFGFFNLLGFELNVPVIIAVFLVTSALVYLVWSMFQPEFNEEEERGGEYVPMFTAIEEEDEENQEVQYQKKKLS